MYLTLVVEQPEGVLYSYAYWAECVESPQGRLDGVRDFCLSLGAEFHQHVVSALLDAHYLRYSVTDLQNLGEI